MKMKVIPAPANSRIKYCLSTLFLVLLAACNKQEPVDLRTKKMDPQQAAQLAENIRSTVHPELEEGLTLSLWGTDSLVADPVSIDIDNQGRLYYTRTNRQKNSEFEIRRHQDWEIPSIRLQTVEDRRKFLHRILAPENSDKNQWLPDLNEDGSHDWKDLTVEKENIYRLEDISGDGVADLSQLMVEDFHEEVTDVAGAILKHNGDLFVGVAPDLWRIKDTNGDGIADEKKSISHGYGVHIGFGGHGMSGLEVGPAGRIYWGIGDIGFNGKGPDGKHWKYPNRGVVVRANPDGSDFEVFAMGVRNTHEFVFDEYGNLISVDNDGDHRGEHERLVYLVNGSDSGWRINWQFGKYRDPDNNTYKVWMDEELWKPRFEGQAAYITPAIASYVSGPAGMLYNPGTALGPEWKNTFFISEFVGNPARSGIHAFKLNPKGATFELKKTDMILKGILATGIDFGPDGAMYIADWIDGWDTKNFGRIWKMDVANGADSKIRQETQRLLAEDFTTQENSYLSGLLKHPDMRVRQKAQFELATRGKDGAAVFEQNISQTTHQLARIHGIWGISQLAREDLDYARILLPLLQDSDPEIRAQAAKWLGDVRYKEAGEKLIPLLKDEYSRARFFAAEALGRIAYEPAIQPIIALLESNNDEDAYIRHAGSLALARIGKADPILALSDHPSRALRMAAVIALRRLQHPGIARFLDDTDEYIVTEAARAINDDFSIEEALPALGDVLKAPRFTNEALIRRAINANLRVGTEESMQNLINYIARKDSPAAMRVEAIQALSTWAKPSVVDRVTGRYRGEVKRDPLLVRENAADALIQLLASENAALRENAAQAIGKLGVAAGSSRLFSLLKNDAEASVRIASLNALAALKDARISQAIEQAISDPARSVRAAGLDLLPKTDLPEEVMVSLLSGVIKTKTTAEKQAALITLGSLPVESSQKVFDGLLTKLEEGNLPPEIHLELAEAIDSTHSGTLIARLDNVREKLSPDTTTVSYDGLLHGGDPARGRTILFSHQAAQCMRCHSIDDIGASVAPRLNGVGGRLSPKEILESLINPSKQIAPGYGMVKVELEDGTSRTGILQDENNQEMVLKIGNRPDTVLLKEHIVKRSDFNSSMPDMNLFLTNREIRDLVSFLVTLKEDNT